MTHWIHMVGREYYSGQSFAREAAQFGVTRRVARATAERMEYGDTVWLAIPDGKSVVMFGKFVVSTLSGLSAEELAKIAEGLDLVQVSAGGRMVSRGCGSYVEASTYAIVDKDGKPMILRTALERCRDAEPKGKLMVGGAFTPVEHVRLKKMKFHQGFRPFDANGYTAAVAALGEKPNKAVSGYYYSEPGNEGNVEFLDVHRAQVVGDYRRKGD